MKTNQLQTELNIIKRDGTTVPFNKTKIRQAVLLAMKNGSGIVLQDIARLIANDAERFFKKKNETPTIQMVEKYVFERLTFYGQDLTARAYEGYRVIQAFKKESSDTDEAILGLVRGTNEEAINENSNKDAKSASTQRDLIAGEISKSLMRRKVLPTKFTQAHDEGILHYHDMDYGVQPIFNCFSGNTKFITNLGVIEFNKCSHGQKIEVLDKDGTWRKATVKQYGKQQLQTITISSGRTIKTIRATKNHRWILKNGDITTNLKIGDRLHLLNETIIDNINNDMFCFGFILGDGHDYISGKSAGLKTRLCGEKVEILNQFIDAGYTVSSYKENGSNDIFLTKATTLSKLDFLQAKGWRYLSREDKVSLFLGYYYADGFKDRNGIATANNNLALMIREISALAGYHITSEVFEIRDTPYKDNAQLYTFRFMTSQPTNRNWVVKNIDTNDRHLYDTWCVEEPITKTFTLDGGVVTGNCCLVNMKDVLDNGTVINKKGVDSPNSFQTACTIATQVMAQVASGQYGGQTISLSHLAPYVRKSYNKYVQEVIAEGKENGIEYTQHQIEKIAKRRTRKEVKDGVQTIQYQINTLATSNGRL